MWLGGDEKARAAENAYRIDVFLLRDAVDGLDPALRADPSVDGDRDNRLAQHCAVQDDFPQMRRMMCATVIDDRPERCRRRAGVTPAHCG